MGVLKTVKISKLTKLLKSHGLDFKRQKGSPLIYDRIDLDRPLVFPVHGKEVKFCYVMQVIRILKMTPDEFIKELNKY
jgi:predicted RNA binding protein YcfA (HicA-like mRNA interferase family)